MCFCVELFIHSSQMLLNLDRDIEDKNISCLTCMLTSYSGHDDQFEELILCHDNTIFCDTLDNLMQENEVEFFCHSVRIEHPPSPEPTTASEDDSSEAQSSDESETTSSFAMLVTKFREMHPGPRYPKDQPLDSKNREWRKRCMDIVSMDLGEKTKFGGRFKQHLAVATLSERCYEACQSIMLSYEKGQLLNQTSRIVNRMLFGEIAGCRHEEFLFQDLIAFRDGRTTKEEFNKRLKDNKKQQRDLNNMEGVFMEENRRLKADLEARNRTIEQQAEQITALQEELRKLKSWEQDQVSHPDNVFEFPAENLPESTHDVNPGTSEESTARNTTPQEETVTTRRVKRVQEYITKRRGKESEQRGQQKMAKESTWLGKTVEARDDDGTWYQAKILEETPTSVKVHWLKYSSSFDSFVALENIRNIQIEFSPGDSVEARYFSTNPTMYSGKVWKTEGNYVFINFDDNTKKRIHRRHVKKLD